MLKLRFLSFRVVILFLFIILIGCDSTNTPDDPNDIDDENSDKQELTSMTIHLLRAVDSSSISDTGDTYLKWEKNNMASAYWIALYDSLEYATSTSDLRTPIFTAKSNEPYFFFRHIPDTGSYLLEIYSEYNIILVSGGVIDSKWFLMDGFDTLFITSSEYWDGAGSVLDDTVIVYINGSDTADVSLHLIFVDDDGLYQIYSTNSDNIPDTISRLGSLGIAFGSDSAILQPLPYHLSASVPLISHSFVTGKNEIIINIKDLNDKQIINYDITISDINGNDMYNFHTQFLSDTFSVDASLKDQSILINIVARKLCGITFADSIYSIDTALTDALKLPYCYCNPIPDAFEINREMVSIIGGIFLMGDVYVASNKFSSNANPAHEVFLSDFELSVSEMTTGEYLIFLNDNMNRLFFDKDLLMFINEDDTITITDTTNDMWAITFNITDSIFLASDTSMPILSVTWYAAAAYCNWLSLQNGLTACYTKNWACDLLKNGYRLPTEAEFEYVASGAFKDLYARKSRFPWGCYSADIGSVAVATQKPVIVTENIQYDIFCNIIGNALEWVNDWSDQSVGKSLNNSSYYIECSMAGVVMDPLGPQSGNIHVLRGGSFKTSVEHSTSYYRFTNQSLLRGDYGFRLARSLE